MKIKVKKLHPDAILPSYARPGDAGMDLYALADSEIKPGEVGFIKTGIAMELPEGYAGLIWDKSGVSTKNRLKVMAGVLDCGYRGDITVCLLNLSASVYRVGRGTKVAQMLIQSVYSPEFEVTEELSDSERGAGGFGSTGPK